MGCFDYEDDDFGSEERQKFVAMEVQSVEYELSEQSKLVEKTPHYGEPRKYDPSFNGPIKNRSCTDVICLILYVICFIGFLLVGIWAFTKGDPRLLLYPTDSNGNLCGYGAYSNRPNVFFFDLIDCYRVGPAVLSQGCPTPQVCVESCPTDYWQWLTLYAQEAASGTYDSAARSKMICIDSVNAATSSKTVQQLVEDGECAAYYVDSVAVVGRCIPAFISQVISGTSDLIKDSNNSVIVDKYGSAVNGTVLEESTKYLAYLLNAADYGTKIFQDVQASWPMILIGLTIGALIAFIWILLMRCLAGPVVWLTLLSFLALFTFGCYYSFTKYVALKNDSSYSGVWTFTTNLSSYLNLKETWLAFGIIAAVLLGIIIIVLLFLRKRILIAIALIKEGSRAVGNMVFTLFWPLVPYIIQVVFALYWGASALYLASSGRASFSATNVTNQSLEILEYNDTADAWVKVTKYQEVVQELLTKIPCDPNANTTAGTICNFLKYGDDQYTIYLQVYQLFMWFWIMNFIVALGEMVLAGSFASYYWAFNKPKDIPTFPVTASLLRALRYHLGSIAFGSLLVAIIQLIRVFLEYLDHKLKGTENKVAKFLLKCLKCCFWCLEKCIRFLNKNAYIMIAVYGKNFCTSAKNAFFLILRNIVRVAVVDKTTDFLMFIGKLMVVGAVGILSYYFFSGELATKVRETQLSTYIAAYTPSLNYYPIPIIIICIGTYVIASAFFGVYSMGVDTLFLSFLEDLERNDGSPEKPYYMSKELMGILGVRNTKDPNGKKKSGGCCGCC
ncbi:hypothetical protein LSH36_194g05083 [Paralvinella palmiformis]|uniref:Choline transporter-like protein n=1 Tax=Paralvinella palmiformis TaxID=53620 RepID=A0AAD9JSA7_9ANNE|nr:hypothetical protein LSH36_194g05083 [Paralvinella palmiformis]